jgi:hypothetical protein
MANIVKSKKDETTLSEEVRKIYSNYNRVSTYHRRNTNNCINNYRFYYGKNPELGFGQYTVEAAQRLLKQNRQLIQHNFVLPLLDNMAASLMQMKLDPSFIPINAEMSSITEIPQKMSYSDKELMNWDNSVADLTLGGLIHEYCVKMVVSTKWDKRGNIGMESMLPNSTFPDPNWRSSCSSDCKHVWHEGWFTAEQIMDMYESKHDLIAAAADRDRKDGLSYGTNHGVNGLRGDMEDKWGSLYKVIEQYDVISKKIKRVYLLRPGGTQVAIPKEIKSDSDVVQFLNAKYPDWQPYDVFEDEDLDTECIVKTICPGLIMENVLESRPTELQIGCTPFKFWSCSRLNGEPRGLLESIKDAQTYINYWSGMLTNKIQVEGGGGAQYVDPNMFENYAEFERYCANRNNPAENFRVKGGYMEKGVMPARPVLTNSGFPTEAYKNLEYIIDKVLPHISKVPPVQYGISDKGDSGFLFQQKKAQADLQAWTIHFGYKNFWNDWYESYLMAASQVYNNEGTEREFVFQQGKERIKANEVVELEDGNYGIKNDMSKLKEIRMQVVVTERPDSPTEQANNILTYSELAGQMSKVPSKAASVGVLLGMISDNIPYPEKDKIVLQNVNKRETDLELLKLDTAILMQKLQLKQAEDQLNAAMNPQPQQQSQGKPPSVSISFKDLPPEGKVQAAEQAGIKLQLPPPPAPTVNPDGTISAAGAPPVDSMAPQSGEPANTPPITGGQ